MAIFVEQTAPETAAEKKRRHQWVQLGAKYLDAKKKDPNLTVKKWTEDNGLKYETASRAFRRFRDEIKQYHASLNPNKTKAQWVQLGVAYLYAKEAEQLTQVEFADRFSLNYETMSRAFRKYKRDIEIEKGLQDAKKEKRKLTRAQRLEQLKKDFRAQSKEILRAGPKAEKKSQQWFMDTMKANIRSHSVSKPKVGRLYAMMYDAKHKNTLPYWDVYPLIVYLGKSARHKHLMLGLNLHYIPPKARAEFLEELLKYADTDRLTNKTTLDIDWSKVKNMRGSGLMIKSYLPDRIKGTFSEIKPADWINVVGLPSQKFVSGPNSKPFNTNKVWRQF